jgi:hypothetical protein
MEVMMAYVDGLNLLIRVLQSRILSWQGAARDRNIQRCDKRAQKAVKHDEYSISFENRGRGS